MRFRLRSDRLLWIASWLSVRARRDSAIARMDCGNHAAPRRQHASGGTGMSTWPALPQTQTSRQDGGGTAPSGTRTPSFAGGCVVHGLAWRRSHGLNAQRFAGLRRTGRNPPHAKPGAVRSPTCASPGDRRLCLDRTRLQDNANHGAGNARKPRRARVMSNRLAQGQGHARWRVA